MLKIATIITQGYSRHLKKHKNKLTHYQYLLQHCPPPWGCCSIKANNVQLITERSNYFDMIQAKLPYINLSSQNFYKLAKVMVLLLNPDYAKKKKFYSAIDKFTKHIIINYFDFKYSEMYEEQLLIRFTQVFEVSNKSWVQRQTLACEFLLFLLDQNEALQKALNLCKNAYQSQENSLKELDFYKVNRQNQQYNKSFNYPSTLLAFIDKKEMFNKLYNMRFRRKYENPLVTWHDQTKNFKISPDMKEELFKVYSKEKEYVENTKISRLDYLSAILFILNRRHYSDKMLSKFHQFLKGHYEQIMQQLHSRVKLNKFLEILMFCRIFEVLEAEKNSIPTQLSKQIQSIYYKIYVQRFLSFFQDLQLETLVQLLSHPSKLFVKYTPANLQKPKDTQRIKAAHKKIFEEILDFYNNGHMLIESFDIQNMWQIIYYQFGKNQLEWIIQMFQKYEKLAYWSSTNSRLDQRREKNKIVYLLLIRFGLKSDILAERLYRGIEKEAWIDSELALIEDRKVSKSQFEIFKKMFHYYLYLQTVETPSKDTSEVERIFLQNLKQTTLALILEKESSDPQLDQQTRFSSFRKNLNFVFKGFGIASNTFIKSFQQKVGQTQDMPVGQNKKILYKMLAMLIKGYQIINKMQSHLQQPKFDSLQKIFLQVYTEVKKKISLDKLISYPNLLTYLCRLSLFIKDKQIKEQILQEVTEISLYLKNKGSFSVCNQSKIFVFDQHFMMQKYNNYVNNPLEKLNTVWKYLPDSGISQQLENYAFQLNAQITEIKQNNHNNQVQQQNVGTQLKTEQNTSEVVSIQAIPLYQLDQIAKQQQGGQNEEQIKKEIIKVIQNLLKNHFEIGNIKQEKQQELKRIASYLYQFTKQRILGNNKQSQNRNPVIETETNDLILSEKVEELPKSSHSIPPRAYSILANEMIYKKKIRMVLKDQKQKFKTPLFHRKKNQTDKNDSLKDYLIKTVQNIEKIPIPENSGSPTQQSQLEQKQQTKLKKMQAVKQQNEKVRMKELRKKLFQKKK